MTTTSTLTGIGRSPTAPVRAEHHAPKPDSGQKADLPVAPFFTPVLRLDPKSERVVMEIRDPTDGKVTRQIPSEQAAASYARADKPE